MQIEQVMNMYLKLVKVLVISCQWHLIKQLKVNMIISIDLGTAGYAGGNGEN